jgi:hypothetical protein
MLPESQKRAQAVSSAPEARGDVYQPVVEGRPVIRLERVNERIGDDSLKERSQLLKRGPPVPCT